MALSEGLSQAALRAYNNLTAFLSGGDRLDEMLKLGQQAIELAQRIGDRAWEAGFLLGDMNLCVLLGEWDRAT